MSKKFLRCAFIFIGINIFGYLLGSFTQASLNIAIWHPVTRGITAISSGIFSVALSTMHWDLSE